MFPSPIKHPFHRFTKSVHIFKMQLQYRNVGNNRKAFLRNFTLQGQNPIVQKGGFCSCCDRLKKKKENREMPVLWISCWGRGLA